MDKQAHLFIYGDVIGVGFRYWTVANAGNLRLSGWVRNAGQKKVEAVIEGPEEKVKEMIGKCRKGPEVSWVEKVEVKWEKATKEFDNFKIRY